ncbi:MAG: hypothetical protein IJ086_10610 [Clostridium sp.]|nr:hypothetical protein [Clostridium sp.]
MKIEVTTTKTNKKDATKYILRKIPLVSKVSQFNNIIGDVHLEYIEFKILKYEIISKYKSNNFFRKELKKDSITMIVNTQNGHSESIDKIPLTSKKYVSKTRIKRTKIKDDDIIIGVKNEIIRYLKKKINKDDKEKVTIQDISVTEIKSIYKPYWVADFRGRNIYIEA